MLREMIRNKVEEYLARACEKWEWMSCRNTEIPAWVDTYGTVLDESSPYGDLLHI